MKSEYLEWFWTECDELNKDTSFAHSLAEKAWDYQQSKVDELQARVDAALERASHACIGSAMFHKRFNEVISILNGVEALKGGRV